MSKHKRKQIQKQSFELNQIEPIIKKWMFEILLFLGGDKEFIRSHDFLRDNVAQALGLEQWIDVKKEDFGKLAIKNTLKIQYSKVEYVDTFSIENKDLEANLNQLADLVGLNQI